MRERLLDLKKLKFELRDIMRYDDVGDYFDDTIVAYDFKDDVVSNAIFLHEFIEYTLVKSAGISPELIDRFDTDPGSEKEYPKEFKLYEEFHDMANMIERQFIENLGLSWDEHDRKITNEKVRVAKNAINRITKELHKEHPDEARIEKSTKEVTNAIKR